MKPFRTGVRERRRKPYFYNKILIKEVWPMSEFSLPFHPDKKIEGRLDAGEPHLRCRIAGALYAGSTVGPESELWDLKR